MAKKNQIQAVEVASTAKKSLKVTSTAKKPLKVASTAKKTSEVVASTAKKPLKENVSTAKKKNKQSELLEEESDSLSEGESDSESDSDSEPAKTNKQPVVTKAKPETSGSAVAVPESSTAKRPVKQAESEAKKKLKTSETEHVKKPATNGEVKKISGDDAKKMFQRLFSETDEIALLQGILDFTSTKGDPYEESDAFCSYVKKLIDFNATKVQIVTKLQRLKKKFVNTVNKSLKKGKSEDEIVFSKDLDQKAFELSRKIWGNNGVLASKSRKKLGGTPAPKEMKLVPHSSPKKQQEETQKPKANVVNTSLTIGREIALFFNAEINASSISLDNSTITAVCEKVADGAEKRKLEEKWKKLKAKQMELCLQRTEIVNETAKMIFKAYES